MGQGRGRGLWEARVVRERERVWKMSSEAEELGGVSLASWAFVCKESRVA